MTLALQTVTASRAPALAAGQRAQTELGLMLVNGALQCIDIARECIECGHDPRRHLRSAALRVRELPATLCLSDIDPMGVSFSDLCEYICRRLGAAGEAQELPSLEEICDLLREICRAWVGPARVAAPDGSVVA